jgi:hypothetical protein
MNRKVLKEAREYIQNLAEKNEGRITPDTILADAKRKSSPLHKFFDWNDQKAGHKWRLEQARGLIEKVEYEFQTKGGTHKTSYFRRDPSVSSRSQGYISIPALKSDKDLAHEALVDAFSMARSYLERANELSSALKFKVREVRALTRRVEGLQEQAQQLS